MSQPPEVKAALINRNALIVVAIIGFVGGLLVALLTPFAARWATPPEPTPNPKSMAIEQYPYTIYPFDGDSDENPTCCAGRAYFQLTNAVSQPVAYGLSYYLPDNSSRFGYAGFAFVFLTSQDLSAYESIQFLIEFDDQVNKADVNLQDITKQKVPYHIVGNGQSEMKVIVPLSYFKGIDLKAIRSIGFQVDSSAVTGNHTFYVKDIRLVKP